MEILIFDTHWQFSAIISPYKLTQCHSSEGYLFLTEKNLWCQCRTQSIFGDTAYSCYCKLRLKTPPWWGLRRQKILILITLDCWKRHFQEKNYIENYFYLLESTKSTKTTSQKCSRNIISADFFECPYRTNDIKTHLGWPVDVDC